MCPACGDNMVLKSGKMGRFYGCASWPECDMTHGAHQDTGEPLGVPADKETRAARIRAHDAFDALWRGPHRRMSRRAAYSWMAQVMGLSSADAHIGRFTIRQCEQLIDALK